MSHYATKQVENRVNSYEKARQHFEANKVTYIRYAGMVRRFCEENVPELANKPESQILMIRQMIMEMDGALWGVAQATAHFSGEELADAFARFVVGHAL